MPNPEYSNFSHANFTSLLGSPYFPPLSDLEGSILFWEIDNIQSYRIEKSLYQLKYAGVLDGISGMVIGKLPGIGRTAWKDFTEPTPQELVLEILEGYTFPILAEVDFGHETVDLVLPLGLEATLDAASLHLELLTSAVI